MDPHWFEAGAVVIANVIIGLIVKAGITHVKAEVLQMKLDVLEAVENSKTWADERFESKEMAAERQVHMNALLKARS